MQRFSASSSSSASTPASSTSSEESEEERPCKRVKTMEATMPVIRNLDWNQLQSLELSRPLDFDFFWLFLLILYLKRYSVVTSMIDCSLVFCWVFMHHTPGTDHKAQTSYQQHGKCVERIKKAMKKRCCKGQCKKNLSFKNVLAMCVAFWSISKSAQDSLLLGKNV